MKNIEEIKQAFEGSPEYGRETEDLLALASKSEPMEGGKVVLAAKDGLENFISASINPTAIEEALFKIRPDPVFEGSRSALEKVFREEKADGEDIDRL